MTPKAKPANKRAKPKSRPKSNGPNLSPLGVPFDGKPQFDYAGGSKTRWNGGGRALKAVAMEMGIPPYVVWEVCARIDLGSRADIFAFEE